MPRPHPTWLAPLVLPCIWWVSAGHRALGRRTGDLVSHVWALWNGGQGDPTRTTLFCWPEGLDLLPIYGGWLHTLVGSALVRAGAEPVAAYTTVVCVWLAVAGLGGIALARAVGAGPWAALVGGLLLQLDGFVLYNAMDGRPEHAGLGFTALALACAVAVWDRGGRGRVVATGLAGALVFLVSWEHALWLALACAWLLPWLHSTPAGRSGRRRWVAAAGVCLLAAGPWLALFFGRALAVRSVEEGDHTVFFAIDQSIGLIRWLVAPGRHPGRGLVLLALALPWLVPRSHRRLAVGAVLGMVGCVVLALGPSPGLWRGGDLWQAGAGRHVIWGPFALLQSVPVLGWFHSPLRLAMGVSLGVAAGGALAVERAARWKRPAGLLLGVALPVYAGVEAWHGGDWPRPGFEPPPFHEVASLADDPTPGAVLSLPPARQGHEHEQRVLFQLLHQRPILGHIYLPFLAPDQTPGMVERVDLFGWVAGAPGWARQAAPDLTEADRALLHDQGIAFVTVYHRELGPARSPAVLAALREAFGAPVAEQPRLWSAFRVRP